MFAIVLLLSLAASTLAADPYAAPPPAYKPTPAYVPAPAYKPAYGKQPVYDDHPSPYTFEYGVHDEYSGANFASAENSDGKVTSG